MDIQFSTLINTNYREERKTLFRNSESEFILKGFRENTKLFEFIYKRNTRMHTEYKELYFFNRHLGLEFILKNSLVFNSSLDDRKDFFFYSKHSKN